MRPRLMPADTPGYMAGAWASCILWAIEDPDIFAAFLKDTDNNWKLAEMVTCSMADDATRAADAFVEQFILWVNENVWGDMSDNLEKNQ